MSSDRSGNRVRERKARVREPGAVKAATDHPERRRSVRRHILSWVPALAYAVWRWLEHHQIRTGDKVR